MSENCVHLGEGSLSFIVPAHNEEAYLPRTLAAIRRAAFVVGRPYEVIVVNDASTDATAAIAREDDARVVTVNHRQIAATRNSGARAAAGEYLFFVDADTIINAKVVGSAVKAMSRGAVGGGAPAWLCRDGPLPLYGWVLAILFVAGSKLMGFTGGAFMFCTRDAFRATGGFDERLYCSEEGGFALALKREGRFAVPWGWVHTSSRRFRKTTGMQAMWLCIRVALFPRRTITRRSSVEKIWYDSNRANDDRGQDSWRVRFSNGIAFVVLLVLLSGPLWNFVPRSLTPRGTVAGDIRLVIGVFLCHVGLVLWPLAAILLLNLFRQKKWTGVMQSVVLIAFFSWQAWGATKGVFWFWPWAWRAVIEK